MEFQKEKIKQIRNLMFLAALLILGIIYSGSIFQGIGFLSDIFKPFIYGGVVAFILNILMKSIEEKLLGSWKGKAAKKLKRPVSMILSIIAIVLVLAIVFGMVLPQIALTV